MIPRCGQVDLILGSWARFGRLTHPDHRTIADFRKRFLDELQALFTEILLIAQAMGLVKRGAVSLDGAKINANASKHKALSSEYANRLEAQLKGEVEELMSLASHCRYCLNNRPGPAKQSGSVRGATASAQVGSPHR